MDQVVARPETKTCAKWTLGGVLPVGALLAAAVFASMLAVELPSPAGRVADGQGGQPYVPASDKWIELGAPAVSDADRLQAELLRRAAADGIRPSRV